MTYALTLVFMFLVFWRPQEWLLPQLYGLPLLDGVVYAALLALIIEVDSGRARLPRTPAVWLLVGLWLATLMSHVPNTYFQGLVDTIPSSFKLCFFMLLMLVVVDSIPRARGVVAVIVLAACVMSVHAILQQKRGYGFAHGMPLLQIRPVTGQWLIRSQFFGIFGDPNDLAQLLAAALPLAFALPRRMNFFGWALALSLAALIFIGLRCTHSRGGQVALVTSCAVMLLLVVPTKWMPYLAAAGLVGGLLLCAKGMAGMMDMSSQERVVFWGMANRVFKQHPTFGIGYGMFWQVAGDRAAHNAFVTCYTEVGIVGYWFWFSILQLGVIGCYRARLALRGAKTLRDVYIRRLAGLSIASIAGYAAGGYFLSRAFIFPFFFLFGLLNAIPVIAQKYLPPKAPALLNTRRHVYGWGTVTTLASIVYIYISILLLNKAFYG
jgi:hypothetical protein